MTSKQLTLKEISKNLSTVGAHYLKRYFSGFEQMCKTGVLTVTSYQGKSHVNIYVTINDEAFDKICFRVQAGLSKKASVVGGTSKAATKQDCSVEWQIHDIGKLLDCKDGSPLALLKKVLLNIMCNGIKATSAFDKFMELIGVIGHTLYILNTGTAIPGSMLISNYLKRKTIKPLKKKLTPGKVKWVTDKVTTFSKEG